MPSPPTPELITIFNFVPYIVEEERHESKFPLPLSRNLT
jgi:hypothetical protein